MDSNVAAADAEEDSESLSLCEWNGPISRKDPAAGEDASSFEFSSGHGVDMCTAEEIFACGMIATNSYKPSSNCHRRSESLDGARTRLLQAAQPAGRLQRASSADGPPVPRCGSCARTSVLQGRLSTSSASRAKWWYLLPFGHVRPPELEMEAIRSRQNKRQWPPAPGSAGDGNKMRWKLLRVLSCSRKEAIAVR